MMNNARYILITAARNEENFIENTIKSVISQSVLPLQWIIVSDGSTDKTDDIVLSYSLKYEFIKLLRIERKQTRNFGVKAELINLGFDKCKYLEFDFVGNLDADISFESSYYQKLLNKFEVDSNLGLAGGIRYDLYNGKYYKIYCAQNSVAGAYQFFRRSCFETIGGYQSLKYGGIDAVAEVLVRMYGWSVESFPEMKVYHRRVTGGANSNMYQVRFKEGIKEYVLGYHPAFLFAQVIFRSFKKSSFPKSWTRFAPLMRMLGYIWAFLRRYQRSVPSEFVEYLRDEQIARLRSILFGFRDPAFRRF